MAGNKKIKIDIGFSVDKTGLESLQSELQIIANKINTLKPNQLTPELKQAANTAHQLDNILSKTFNSDLGTLNVTKFNQELKKSGMTIQSVKADLVGAGNQGATAYNKMAQAILGTNTQLRQTNKLLDSMATTMVNTVKWGITSSIFNTITNSIQKAYSYTKQLDTSLNDIRIVTSKSADEMDNFAEKANKAAKNLGASTLDYTNASLIYYQQGLSDEEVAARAETTVKVANVTGQIGDAVSEQLTAVWNGYKVSAEETEVYIDKLAAVAASTAADLEELSKGMSKVASAANAMGVDFDDLNAQIATIVSVTRQAPESVGTALKTIYARLGDLKVDGVDEFGVKLGEVSSQLQTMGIQILDTNGDMRDMTTVMAEVAEKWDTWTRAQQQAAAVAMAGKRQYNNLVALFENWDMYSDALETSIDSLGTLQEQQDIYMESTVAKLKTLKATWQDLYKGLLKNSEINTVIDDLTNIVDVFAKFTKSFGGGIKSITAFGLIFANIFDKQIGRAIIQAENNLHRFETNLDSIKAKNSIMEQEVAPLDDNATPQQSGALENTRLQLEYAQKIYDIRHGLTEEQYNELTNYQKELGLLKEKEVILEKEIENIALKSAGSEEINKLIHAEAFEISEIREAWAEVIEEADEELIKRQNIVKSIQKEFEATEDLEIKKANILRYTETLTEEDQKRINSILLEVGTNDQLALKKKEILDIIQQHEGAQRKYVNGIQEEVKLTEEAISKRLKLVNIQEQQNNLQQQADDLLKMGNSAQKASLSLTSLIAPLSTIAMLWGTLNTLKEAWSTDNDMEFGDRIRQSLMAIGMLAPQVISLLTKTKDIMGGLTNSVKAYNVAVEAQNKINTARNVLLNTVTSNIGKNTVANQVSAMVQDIVNSGEAKETVIQELQNASTKKRIQLLGSMSIEQLTSIGLTKQEAAALIELKTAQDSANASALANPYVLMAAAVIAAIMGMAYAITKLRETSLKAAAERSAEIKSIREENAEKQKEIEENNKLYDSYLSLYEQYKNGNASKADMAQKSEELSDKLSKESLAVAQLTGDYEYLAQAIEKAKGEGLEYDANIDQDTMNQTLEAARNDLANFLDKNAGYKKEDAQNMVKDMTMEDIRDYVHKERARINKEREKYKGHGTIQIGANVGLDLRENKLNSIDTASSEYAVAEQDKNIKQGYLDIINNQEVNNLDYEGYKNLVEQAQEMKSKYQSGVGVSRDAILEDLDKYTSGNEQNKLKFLAIDQVLQDYANSHVEIDEEQLEKDKKEIENYLISLSDADFNKVITQIEVDEYTSVDNIKRAIGIAQQDVNQEDLSIVTSLRAKVSSNKKLSKTEMKEALGEQETLTSEYEVGLSDWDNQSQLDQVEILNDIVRDKIQAQWEYVNNIKKIAEEEKKIEEDRKQKFLDANKAELEELRKKKETANKVGDSSVAEKIYTPEDQKRLEELEHELDNIDQKIEYWNEVSIEGLAFEDLNEITFNNLISGIDGLISETQVLADLVAKVGENWTIAGKDIQEFAQNFPEVFAEQENFNYLQDGSIQLTEQGKKALDESLDSYKEKIRLENESYQAELQKQADIQIATAEMYEAQAQALDDYLSGQATGAETEAKLAKNVNDYKDKLQEQLGLNEKELTELMIDNGLAVVEQSKDDTSKIYDYWVAVGEVAAKAGTAYANGFDDPGRNPSGLQSGIKVTEARDYKPQKVDQGEFQGLTNEEVAAYRDELLKKAVAARNEAAIYVSKKLGSESEMNAMLNAMDNAISGKGNGKASKSKEEKEKQIDEEFDRYWEYKKAIDMLDKAMARLQKTQAKLHGKELIDSLKKENELLEKQKANYDALLHAQEREAGELQGKLDYFGATFADSGELTNYADVTSSMLDKLTSGQVSEKAYEDFKKALERYDSLYYSEIQDTLDKLDDARRKQLENNLKGWETEIQIKLDLTEAERNWNDFVRDLEQDFRKIYEDLTIESAYDTANFDTYVDDLNTTLQAIYDVENEITKLSSVGKSDMFESMSEAQEKLKDLGNELIENGKNLYELYESVWDNYINQLDQSADNLKDINDEFGHITNELEYEKKLIELIYGDKAYDKMTKYYDAQQKNINMQIDSLKTQRDFWEDQFQAAYMMNKDEHSVILNDMSTWTEDMRKAYDQMIESQESLNDKITEGIENLTDNYLNKLAETFDKLENAVWNMNLDALGDDWDRITGLADEYLDDVEGAYEIQNLANQIDKDINNTSDIKAAQRLQAFREKEIAILREKDNLTQDDVDLAEARYQIMLKEIALEDAQNAKNSMKLTRNTSGNWTYQYVADDEDVADKRQDLLQSYQNLYKMADDAYQHAMELATGSYQEMQDKIREIAEDTTLAEEEKMLKIQEIQDTYLPMIEAAVENSELYRQEAITATGAVFEEVCQQDADAYQYLTDLQKELVDGVKDKHLEDYEAIRSAVVDGVYPEIAAAAQSAFLETNLNSSTAAADVIHQWADDDGESVKAKLNDAIDSIESNVQEFEGELDKMKIVAGKDFTDVDTEINTTTKLIEEMERKTKDMTEKSSEKIGIMRTAVEQLGGKFEELTKKIMTTSEEMANYRDAISEAVKEMIQLNIQKAKFNDSIYDPTADIEKVKKSFRDDDSDKTSKYRLVSDPYGAKGTMGIYNETTGKYEKIMKEAGSQVSIVAAGANNVRINSANGYTIADKDKVEENYLLSDDGSRGWYLGPDLLKQLQQQYPGITYATGGYTGDWSSDNGSLAFLHQKELVLNETDTSNFLKATSLLRDISQINGSIEDSIMTSILGMMNALSPRIGGFSTGSSGSQESNGNIFNITAEFPNANDVTSIREAILSLPNIASQYVHQR